MREFGMFVIENGLGTPVPTPTNGTQRIWVRYDGGNASSVQMRPRVVEAMAGNGRAIMGWQQSGQQEVRGTIRTHLYASQARFFLDLALGLINAGQTSPFTTTEPPDDLPSFSYYHAYQFDNGSVYKRRRYAGCKIERLQIAATEGAQDHAFRMQLDVVGVRAVGNQFDSSSDPTAVEFPLPTGTQLPTDPYLFNHTALTLGGVARPLISGLTLTVTNTIDPRWYNNRFPQVVRGGLGRVLELQTNTALRATPDDLAAFEALSAQACSLVLNNGTVTTTVNLQGQNRFRELGRVLELERVYEYGLTVRSQLDQATGTDATYTVA